MTFSFFDDASVGGDSAIEIDLADQLLLTLGFTSHLILRLVTFLRVLSD